MAQTMGPSHAVLNLKVTHSANHSSHSQAVTALVLDLVVIMVIVVFTKLNKHF